RKDPDGLLTQAQSTTLTSIAAQLQGILGALNAIRASGGGITPGQAGSIQQFLDSAKGAITGIANGGGATVVPSATTWAPQSGLVGVTPNNNITNSGPISASKSDTSIPINTFGICGGGSAGLGAYGSVSGCGAASSKDAGFFVTGGGGGTTGLDTDVGA